jgi:Putative zinc-finger
MNHVSTLDLHRLRYGELDKARAAEVRAHVDGCATCTERLQAQHAMRAEFEVRPVPAALREASKRPRVPTWVWALLPGLMVAALALFVVLPADVGTPDEDVHYKGGGVELLLEGKGVVDPEATRFHEGDKVQVRIAPGHEGQAWVTDGHQVLGTFPLEAGRATLAPFSLTLDGQPGAEHLVVLVSREMLRDDQIQRILVGRRMPGVDVTYLELNKTGP